MDVVSALFHPSYFEPAWTRWPQRAAASDAVGRRPGYVEPRRPVYVIAFNLSVTHMMSHGEVEFGCMQIN